MGGQSWIDFMYFWGSNKKQWSCDGRGGGARSAPFGGGSELKKTGARSARARTRGQNPLVDNKALWIHFEGDTYSNINASLSLQKQHKGNDLLPLTSNVYNSLYLCSTISSFFSLPPHPYHPTYHPRDASPVIRIVKKFIFRIFAKIACENTGKLRTCAQILRKCSLKNSERFFTWHFLQKYV